MTAHDTEDLLATLNAAEFFIRTQASIYLGFPALLRVESEGLSLARGLLEAVGVGQDAPVPRPAARPAAAPPRVPTPPPAPAREPAWVEEVDVDEPEELAEVEPEPEPEPEWEDAELETEAEPLRAVAAAAEPEPERLFEPEELEEISPLDETPVELDDEDVGDPATFGEPEETEDLLRDQTSPARTVAEAMGVGGSDDDAFDTHPRVPDDAGSAERDTEVEDDDFELEFDDPGQDALVTIEDTSDPRSDLEGLSRLGDSDLEDDDDSVEDEVIVRKDDGVETFDLMPEPPASDMSPDEEETFVADLADIERMKAKMDAGGSDDASDATDDDIEIVVETGEPAAPRRASPGVKAATPRPVAPRLGAPAVAAAPRVAAGGPAGVTAGLYGNPAVPTIRDRNEPKPRAAAIQIDAAQEQAAKGASGAPLLEEEELLELGSSEDYGEEEMEGGEGGLSIEVQEYEEELEEVEIEEDDIELEEIEEDVPLEPIDDGPSPAELDAMLHKAAAAVEQGDMEAGIDFYSDVLDSDPENVDAHVKRGRLYLDYGDYSRAMSDFMMAEELAPDSPEPQIAVGDLYFARKDYNRAIDYFNEALKMAPNHAMAFCRRGISHYYRKNYSQALEDLNRAEKVDADIPNIRTYITMAKKKVRK